MPKAWTIGLSASTNHTITGSWTFDNVIKINLPSTDGSDRIDICDGNGNLIARIDSRGNLFIKGRLGRIT